MKKRRGRGNPDQVRKRNIPAPENAEMAARLTDLMSPLVYRQLSYYRQLGLRDRDLGLPLMVAVGLALLWRQVPSVSELSRLRVREDLLWCKATAITQQALSTLDSAKFFSGVTLEAFPHAPFG